MNIDKWLCQNTHDLTGKTVAVTGATGGIGKELCVYLARLNANLILLNRNGQKSIELKSELKRINPKINITEIPLNLEDFSSVVSTCQVLKTLPIDILIHNAGAYNIPRKITDIDLDNVFQINFFAPYYMTKQLLCLMKENSRVVLVGSIAHNYIKSNKQNFDLRDNKHSNLVYGNAKRHLMFSFYKLFKNEKNVKLSVCHPGITFTNITSHYPKLIFALIKHPMKMIFMKPKIATLSILLGCFEDCDFNEWIGPCIFNIWGKPKKQKLNTVSKSESEEIFKTAEELYKKATR